MSGMSKVVVVDNGERRADHGLSVELAELGYASVTTTAEATDDVLSIISPAAIVIQLPDEADAVFMALAERLRRTQGKSGVPVILVDRKRSVQSGGYASLLASEFASNAVSKPDL